MHTSCQFNPKQLTCRVDTLLHQRAELATALAAVSSLRKCHRIRRRLTGCTGLAPALAARVDLSGHQPSVGQVEQLRCLQRCPGEADLAGLAGGVSAHAQRHALCHAAPAGAPLSVQVCLVAQVVNIVGAVLADIQAVGGGNSCRRYGVAKKQRQASEQWKRGTKGR